MIFRRRKFNFFNKFKGVFEAKLWEDFGDFEKDGKIERQNNRIETRMRVTTRASGLLKFVQGFINDWRDAREKARDFK